MYFRSVFLGPSRFVASWRDECMKGGRKEGELTWAVDVVRKAVTGILIVVA